MVLHNITSYSWQKKKNQNPNSPQHRKNLYWRTELFLFIQRNQFWISSAKSSITSHIIWLSAVEGVEELQKLNFPTYLSITCTQALIQFHCFITYHIFKRQLSSPKTMSGLVCRKQLITMQASMSDTAFSSKNKHKVCFFLWIDIANTPTLFFSVSEESSAFHRALNTYHLISYNCLHILFSVNFVRVSWMCFKIMKSCTYLCNKLACILLHCFGQEVSN